MDEMEPLDLMGEKINVSLQYGPEWHHETMLTVLTVEELCIIPVSWPWLQK